MALGAHLPQALARQLRCRIGEVIGDAVRRGRRSCGCSSRRPWCGSERVTSAIAFSLAAARLRPVIAVLPSTITDGRNAAHRRLRRCSSTRMTRAPASRGSAGRKTGPPAPAPTPARRNRRSGWHSGRGPRPSARHQAGRVADRVPRPFPTSGLRPHEGLVVEAGRNEAREPLHDGHAVVLDGGLGVHAGGAQAFVELAPRWRARWARCRGRFPATRWRSAPRRRRSGCRAGGGT